MEKTIKECVICGTQFIALRRDKITCGGKDCIRQNYNEKRRMNRGRNKHKITPKMTNRPTGKKWEQLPPCKRWEFMSLEEISAECARLHLSYGQAQVLKERKQLPRDFGEKIRR